MPDPKPLYIEEPIKWLSWLLLRIGETGNWNEAFAQFYASLLVENTAEEDIDALDFMGALINRTRELVVNQDQIWMELMPGGGQGLSEHDTWNDMLETYSQHADEPDGPWVLTKDEVKQLLEVDHLVNSLQDVTVDDEDDPQRSRTEIRVVKPSIDRAVEFLNNIVARRQNVAYSPKDIQAMEMEDRDHESLFTVTWFLSDAGDNLVPVGTEERSEVDVVEFAPELLGRTFITPWFMNPALADQVMIDLCGIRWLMTKNDAKMLVGIAEMANRSLDIDPDGQYTDRILDDMKDRAQDWDERGRLGR